MKKVLLTGAIVFAALSSSWAQCIPCLTAEKPAEAVLNGYHPDAFFAKDYFARLDQYDNVYWWTQLDGPKDVVVDSNDVLGVGACVQFNRKFAYTPSRSLGKISYVLTQQYGLYEPFGVGFGFTKTSPTDSTANTLDLSNGNAKVYFRFTNTSAYDLGLRVALQDSKDSIVNAVGTSLDTEVYKDEVNITVPKGKTVDTTVTFNTNAYKALYDYLPCHVGSASGKGTSFDPTKVAGVAFTVVNVANSGVVDGYKPFPLVNATFEISKFYVGDYAAPVGIMDNYIAKPSFKVSPNPVNSGSVKFEKAENVTVTDLMGKLVYSTPSASEINVEGFNKGVYIITTSKGAARFVVE